MSTVVHAYCNFRVMFWNFSLTLPYPKVRDRVNNTGPNVHKMKYLLSNEFTRKSVNDLKCTEGAYLDKLKRNQVHILYSSVMTMLLNLLQNVKLYLLKAQNTSTTPRNFCRQNTCILSSPFFVIHQRLPP